MNGLFSKVRSYVSADKNRYQLEGHDLDLTYITERLIAMSFPAEGFESSYRNDINAVARFLKEKHGNRYMIFNLCSERGYNYGLFDHQVQGWCGFPDHHAPPLALIFRIMKSIDEWLAKDPQNVVVIHCKAGKGRTGTISALYMLYCGLFSSASVALNYFAHQRSNNMFGVSSPAQRRFVHYGADIIANQSIPPTPRLIMQQVILTCLPKLDVGAAESHQEGELVLEVLQKTKGKVRVHRSTVALHFSGDSSASDAVIFTVNCMVQGDVQIDLSASKIGLLGKKSTQKICFVQFHTTMCETTMVFQKQDCDKAAYDKRFPPNFELCVSFDQVESASVPYDPMGEDDIIANVKAVHERDGTNLFFTKEYESDDELWTRIREVRAYASPLNESTEKAGWLCKQGLTVRNWKDRWFVLKGDALSYYKSPKNTSPNGQIPLHSIYTITLLRDRKIEPSQPYPNSLILRTELRDFVVCSTNLIELDEWREAIQVASAQQHQHDLQTAPSVGKLFLVILEADNLMPNGIGKEQSMRPYCVASLAKQKYQMAPQVGQKPAFGHQVLEFNVNSLASALQITLWDDQTNLAPRYLGQVSLALQSLVMYRTPTSLWYPLMKRTQLSLVSGSIHLMIYFNEKGESKEAFAAKLNLMAGNDAKVARSHTNPTPRSAALIQPEPKSQSMGVMPMAAKKPASSTANDDFVVISGDGPSSSGTSPRLLSARPKSPPPAPRLSVGSFVDDSVLMEAEEEDSI